MMPRRRSFLPGMLVLSVGFAIVYGATSPSWHTLPTPQAETERRSRLVARQPRLCVTADGVCRAAALPIGDPCTCPDLLRGLVPGRVELPDTSELHPGAGVGPNRTLSQDPYDWRSGGQP